MLNPQEALNGHQQTRKREKGAPVRPFMGRKNGHIGPFTDEAGPGRLELVV
jgi:hypothetical protein